MWQQEQKVFFRWLNSRHNWFPNQRQRAQSLALDLILGPEGNLDGFVVLPGDGSFVFLLGAFPWWTRRGRCLSVIEGCCWMISNPCLRTFQMKLVCLVKIGFILRCRYGSYCKHSNSICEPSLETFLFPAACTYWLEETATKPTGCPTLCLFYQLGLTFTKKILPVWTHRVILIFNVTLMCHPRPPQKHCKLVK